MQQQPQRPPLPAAAHQRHHAQPGTPVSKRRRVTGGAPPKEVSVCKFQISSQEQHVCFDRFLSLYEQGAMCDVVLRVTSTVPDRGPGGSGAADAEADTGGAPSVALSATAVPAAMVDAPTDMPPGASWVDFQAHKCVLAGYPSFLSAMFEAGMRESQQTVIELHETDPQHFKLILDYIYGKAVDIPSTDLIPVLGLASRYQVAGLRDKACEALQQALAPRNSATIFRAADEFMCSELRDRALAVLVNNFAVASNTAGFGALTQDLLAEVLQSDLIIDCDEAIVLEGLQRWLAAGAGPPADWRPAQTDALLGLVRFPLMNTTYLSEVVKKLPLMQSPTAKALLSEAFEHIALVHTTRDCPGLGTPRTKPRRRSCAFEDETLLTGHTDAVSALTVFQNKLVSGSWDTTIRVWNLEHFTLERTISQHAGPVLALEMVSNNLISASGDCTLMVWNPETWGLVRSLDDHTDVVNCICQFEDRLVSGSDDGTIKLWSTTTWTCEVTLHSASATAERPNGVLCLVVCDNHLVSGSAADGSPATIKIWNTTNWTDTVLETKQDSIWALQVCTCADGSKLFSASVDSSIQVWDSASWTPERTLQPHSGPVYALTCFGGKVISGSDDETIHVWGYDAAESAWKPERTLRNSGVWSLTHFHDRLVAGFTNHTIKIFQ